MSSLQNNAGKPPSIWNIDKVGFVNIRKSYLPKHKVKSKKKKTQQQHTCVGRKYSEHTQMTKDSCYKYTKDYKLLNFKSPVEKWVKNMTKSLTYGEINKGTDVQLH